MTAHPEPSNFPLKNRKNPINNAGLPDEGNYYVVVGSFYGGSVQSSNATLTISRPPNSDERLPRILGFRTTPASSFPTEGQSASVTVGTVGWKPLIFQWLLNGQLIPEATNEVYSIASVTTNQAGIYSLIVSNPYGSATNSAPPFAVKPLPRATNDFFSNRASLDFNGRVVYTSNGFATVEPDEPPPRVGVGGHSLWWTWTAPANGVASFQVSSSTFSAVVSLFHGDTLKTLTSAIQTHPYEGWADIQVEGGETLQVSVDSFYRDVGSLGIGVTFSADPFLDAPPSIASTLADTNLLAGDVLEFSVAPTGTHPLIPHWFKDGVLLPQFTGTNLVITNVQSSDAGNYSVTVTNQNGSASTPSAAVAVIPSVPVLLSAPSNVWVTEGYPLRLEVKAKGTAPLSFQWNLDGIPLSGETNAVLKRTAATRAHNGVYSASIVNSQGRVSSPSTPVTILKSPIRYQWSTLAGFPGQSGTDDGQGSAARFWSPSGIAQDGNGNLIIADAGSGSLRLVTPTGDVSTIASGFGFPVGDQWIYTESASSGPRYFRLRRP